MFLYKMHKFYTKCFVQDVILEKKRCHDLNMWKELVNGLAKVIKVLLQKDSVNAGMETLNNYMLASNRFVKSEADRQDKKR
jgi:hypothetical protein